MANHHVFLSLPEEIVKEIDYQQALSSLLFQAELSGCLTGIPTSPRGPRLSHLFFADDSLLFCRAHARDWGRLSQLLECYEKASGQQLNKEKSSIFSIIILVQRQEIVLSGYLEFLVPKGLINT
jgi:hypothetical protein